MVMPILHIINFVNADEQLAFTEIETLISKTSSIDTVIRRVKQILVDYDFTVGCSEKRVWIVRKSDWNPVLLNESLQKRTAEIVFMQDVWNEKLEEVTNEQVCLSDLIEKSELISLAQQVHEMREAQRSFFKLKKAGLHNESKEVLKKCFELEASLDKRIRDVLKYYKYEGNAKNGSF